MDPCRDDESELQDKGGDDDVREFGTEIVEYKEVN